MSSPSTKSYRTTNRFDSKSRATLDAQIIMPRYRYEAVDQSGVPIHGTSVADDEQSLAEQLSERRQRLVSVTELSLSSLLLANQHPLPRLHQLRVGEQLREALLTGLPAHQAVRAIAAEPFFHPLQGMMPWIQGTAIVVFLCSCVAWWFTGAYLLAAQLSAAFAAIVVPAAWLLVRNIYQVSPKALLRRLAERLESGESVEATLSVVMPTELQMVMTSNINDETKARVAADLVPNAVAGHQQTQQFVMTLIGPLAVLCIMMLGVYTTMLMVVPRFKEIFEDFGTELPAMTELVISLSDIVVSLGGLGWILFTAMSVVGLIFLAVMLAGGRLDELLEKVLVFGIAFRWAMQARVARVLSSMIRNNCPYPEAVRTATAASGFLQVKFAGEVIAKSLETGGQPVAGSMAKLSGLPISMMFADTAGVDEGERRAALADTFQSLSEMLSSATVGQGRLFAMMIQFFLVFFTGFVVAFGVLAMFLPLIKLLNDLS